LKGALLDLAVELVERARERSVTLRVLGPVAVVLHSEEYIGLYEALDRRNPELRLAGYLDQSKAIEGLMRGEGFEPLSRFGPSGRIYSRGGKEVKVFFGKLSLNHDLDLEGRLEADYPTAPLSELVLEASQTVRIGEEIKDLIVLFLAHEVGEGDDELINLGRISRVLARDWGFYYTATRNLRKVRNLLERYPQLTEEERGLISERIGRVLERVEREPKGLKWRLRAKIGVSKKWYREL